MKVVILTVPSRYDLAAVTYQSCLDVCIPEDMIHVIDGYEKEHFKLKLNKLVIKSFIDKIVLQHPNEDLLYIEDGTILQENPLNIITPSEYIEWLGYIRRQKNYIVGCKVVYFPKEHIKKIIDRKRFPHMDRAIYEYGIKNECLYIHPHTIVKFQDYETSIPGTGYQYKWKEKLKRWVNEGIQSQGQCSTHSSF